MPKILTSIGLCTILCGCLATGPYGRAIQSLMSPNVCWSGPGVRGSDLSCDLPNEQAKNRLWHCGSSLNRASTAPTVQAAQEQLVACMKDSGWNFVRIVG